MFQIKICGVQSAKDAQLAMLAGADAVGLNFFERSVRYLDQETAAKICAVLPPKIMKVGVFVNASPETINDLSKALKLDAVQLHGDEPAGFLAELPDLPIIRAFRFDESGTDPILAYLEACETEHLPAAILIDACRPGQFGGTGEAVDWQLLAEQRSRLRQLPLILAGGLTPFNVMEAISTVQPDAVDVASGVENDDGQKDPMLLRAFVQSAKKAFAALKGESTS